MKRDEKEEAQIVANFARANGIMLPEYIAKILIKNGVSLDDIGIIKTKVEE